MKNCPNCNYPITDQDAICPHCGFNLKKYRESFLNKHDLPEKDSANRVVSRAVYRQSSITDKPTTVKKMLMWLHFNSTIVFFIGVGLLIIMSFSRSFGWISFFGLLIWLFIVCDQKKRITRYTADRRLTEEFSRVGTAWEQSIETTGENLEKKYPNVQERVEYVKRSRKNNFGYVQLSVILTSFISLIVLFSGSGASVIEVSYPEKMTISRVLLNFAGRLLSLGDRNHALILYLCWLLLIIFPVGIIINIFKNTTKSQVIAFILSLLESISLIYLIFRLTSTTTSVGIIGQITSQLLTYAVSIGTSTYLLILASVITTILAGYNLFVKKRK